MGGVRCVDSLGSGVLYSVRDEAQRTAVRRATPARTEESMSQAHDGVSRRDVLTGAATLGGAALLGGRPRAVSAQSKPAITYWNGLTGADGKVMDELIGQFTRETGIAIEQQRIPWAELYAKLQVSVPAGEGPDLALIHTVEVPHFASDGILDVIADGAAGGKGFRADDYLPA